jgi:DnaJ-class molecular chaperone
VKTGSKVRVPGEVGKGVEGQQAGDLFLKINVLPHPVFERKGDDLYCEVSIDLYTAALGGEISVPTLKGKMLTLRIPPETQSGRTFRLQGQGMPVLRNPSEHGDLYAKARIVLPTPLSEQEKASLKELAGLRKEGCN